MFAYKRYLAYPINIKKKDLKMAKYIITQYGGPYGELGAALRYFNQRYTMPDGKGKALLTDIATEELGHVEMICAMVNQLTKGATEKELKESGLDLNYAQHGMEITPADVFGVPFSTTGTLSLHFAIIYSYKASALSGAPDSIKLGLFPFLQFA